MNIPIAVITVYNIFVLFHNRVDFPARSRFLIYVGAIMPIGDYVLRFALGEVWFQSNGYVFHSFIYQGLIWGIAAILHWAFFQDIKRSLQTLLPLAGLSIYFLLTTFTNDGALFFRPVSDVSFHLNLMSSGFLIPLIVSLIFLVSRRWSDVSTAFASRVSVGVLAGILLYSGVMRTQVEQKITGRVNLSDIISLTPINQAKTLWYIVSQTDQEYYGAEFHIFQGWQEDLLKKRLYIQEQPDAAQVALMDPIIRRIYLNQFRNPVLQVENGNEFVDVIITEFVPLREIFWIKKASLRKNKSGQIISYDIDYGTLI